MYPLISQMTVAVVWNMQKFEVGQRTAQSVRAACASATNDEVDRTGAARVALAAQIELVLAADGLRVERRRQGGQKQNGDGEDEDCGTNASKMSYSGRILRHRRRPDVQLIAASTDKLCRVHCRRHCT